MTIPDWLPAMFPVNPWSGDTYEALYQIFCRDLRDSRPTYRGAEVWFFVNQMDEGKEELFWHLTTRKDKATGERFPDFRRIERFPWVRPMIDHPDKPEVLDWDHDEGDGTVKTYIWLKDYDFIVIMKKMNNGSRRIITSYWIEYEHERRKNQKKYDRRIR